MIDLKCQNPNLLNILLEWNTKNKHMLKEELKPDCSYRKKLFQDFLWCWQQFEIVVNELSEIPLKKELLKILNGCILSETKEDIIAIKKSMEDIFDLNKRHSLSDTLLHWLKSLEGYLEEMLSASNFKLNAKKVKKET